jgi:hypothetical protein
VNLQFPPHLSGSGLRAGLLLVGQPGLEIKQQPLRLDSQFIGSGL